MNLEEKKDSEDFSKDFWHFAQNIGDFILKIFQNFKKSMTFQLKINLKYSEDQLKGNFISKVFP